MRLVMLLIVWALSSGMGTTAAQPREQAPGSSVREVTLEVSTLDHGRWQLSQARGHWVLVNIWATWCGPCITEMPELDEYARSHPEVRVIGLAWQDASPAHIRRFLQRHRVSYPVAIIDPFAPIGRFKRPTALPTTYLIDPQGVLAHTFSGPITAALLERAMADPRS
ncbi:MAG: TlpA disulfide reductase family protein [Comamonadaceae bacterium]|nr:TlpA family protein disulfide reductase [Burkholderiales bacterium]MEB2347126.1 TlpA disulfide reductase family protein [Comamonadaceae bacterium]